MSEVSLEGRVDAYRALRAQAEASVLAAGDVAGRAPLLLPGAASRASSCSSAAT